MLIFVKNREILGHIFNVNVNEAELTMWNVIGVKLPDKVWSILSKMGSYPEVMLDKGNLARIESLS